MIERHFTADKFNEILNDPSVRPDVADLKEGVLDVASLVANHENVLLVGEHGGNAFIKIMPGIYEVHTAATDKGRGEWIRQFVRQAAQMMFTQTDCFEITTRIPRKHVGARKLAESVGMTFEFEIERGCAWRGKRQSVDIYSYRIQDWIKQAHELEPIGAEFHEKLHREAERLGITDKGHPDWPIHNKYVGATWLMARSGQLVKATNWYNRWSVVARHSPIKLIGLDPPTIEMDIGVLTLRGNEIGVRRCAGPNLKIVS
jgi:hypothetical protein